MNTSSREAMKLHLIACALCWKNMDKQNVYRIHTIMYFQVKDFCANYKINNHVNNIIQNEFS